MEIRVQSSRIVFTGRGEDNSDISFEIEHSSGVAFVPSLSNKEAEYRLKKCFQMFWKLKVV